VPSFKYVATSAAGQRSTGVLRGSSAEGVANSLLQQGYDVRLVKPHRPSILQFEITSEKVDRTELGNFSRQMAAFIKAGVPILDALLIIRDEAKDKKLAQMLSDVMDSLRFGDSFATAMAEHDKALPPFYISVLRSAEATGDLDVVMGQLAGYLERDAESRRTVRSALTYPILVSGLAVVTVLVMVIFVLPRFETFFDSFHAKLPLATRLLLDTTRFITTWYILIIAAVVVFVLGSILALRTRRGRELRDAMVLRLPVIGEVVRYLVIERFCRVMASMIKAGVPMPDALKLAGDGTNNVVYENALAQARQEMLEGGGISGPIARTGLFPGSVTQMMRVGEETGVLDEQLDNLAEYYGHELEHKLKRLTNLFEPAIIVAVGVVVGFVAIAMISAIYGIYDQVNLK
jgi:type IV pilus assembly protein PilC